jgi:hypothetical protein
MAQVRGEPLMTPDTALCCDNVKKDCPLAPRCYRATAEPDEVRQSYFAPSNPGEGCSYFIPTSSTPDAGSGNFS